jgi:hypothetical protein
VIFAHGHNKFLCAGTNEFTEHSELVESDFIKLSMPGRFTESATSSSCLVVTSIGPEALDT